MFGLNLNFSFFSLGIEKLLIIFILKLPPLFLDKSEFFISKAYCLPYQLFLKTIFSNNQNEKKEKLSSDKL